MSAILHGENICIVEVFSTQLQFALSDLDGCFEKSFVFIEYFEKADINGEISPRISQTGTTISAL